MLVSCIGWTVELEYLTQFPNIATLRVCMVSFRLLCNQPHPVHNVEVRVSLVDGDGNGEWEFRSAVPVSESIYPDRICTNRGAKLSSTSRKNSI